MPEQKLWQEVRSTEHGVCKKMLRFLTDYHSLMPNSQCLCLTSSYSALVKACMHKAQTAFMGGKTLPRPCDRPAKV